MIENKWLIFLNDKKRWLALFVLTYLIFWYWLPEEVPLYYSFALRPDKLAGKYDLLFLPLFVVGFFFLGQEWLEKLALQNLSMVLLIRIFLAALATFTYFVFLRLILLII